jgi:hypothetical protein
MMGSFGIALVTERFEMARQLGNLFVISPEIIKSYMSESHLAKIDDRLLRPYLMQRADFGDYSKRFWADIVGARGRFHLHARADVRVKATPSRRRRRSHRTRERAVRL